MLSEQFYKFYNFYTKARLFNTHMQQFTEDKKTLLYRQLQEDSPYIDVSLNDVTQKQGALVAGDISVDLDQARKVGTVNLVADNSNHNVTLPVFHIKRPENKEVYFILGEMENRQVVVALVELGIFKNSNYPWLNKFNFKVTSLTWKYQEYHHKYIRVVESLLFDCILPIEKEIITDTKYSEAGAISRKNMLKRAIKDYSDVYTLLEFKILASKEQDVFIREITNPMDIDLAFTAGRSNPVSSMYNLILVCTKDRASAFDHLLGR